MLAFSRIVDNRRISMLVKAPEQGTLADVAAHRLAQSIVTGELAQGPETERSRTGRALRHGARPAARSTAPPGRHAAGQAHPQRRRARGGAGPQDPLRSLCSARNAGRHGLPPCRNADERRRDRPIEHPARPARRTDQESKAARSIRKAKATSISTTRSCAAAATRC